MIIILLNTEISGLSKLFYSLVINIIKGFMGTCLHKTLGP